MSTAEDILMSDVAQSGPVRALGEQENADRFVVAIDFGTTLSSVAYVRYNSPIQRRRLGLGHVGIIDGYPGLPHYNIRHQEVPSEIWYSGEEERQTDISALLPQFDVDSDDSDSESDGVEEQRTIAHLRAQHRPLPISSDTADTPASASWGFEVQKKLLQPNSDQSDPMRLGLFKLMLDDTKRTEEVRLAISRSCAVLVEKGLINNETDVIADYLDLLFRHVKTFLSDSQEYDDRSTVEFVLCIPAVWKSKACRQMEIAMCTAIKNSRFGKLQHNSIDNLFIVTEPEAAAACVIAEEKTSIRAGDTFVLLDAGGGTVDAVTYTVHREEPLRLATEAVMAGGDLCGSSFINKEFEKLLRRKLKDEFYLFEGVHSSLSSIVNALVVKFEREIKSNLDIWHPSKTDPPFGVDILGLRPNSQLRFAKDRLYLTRKEVKNLFKDCLEGVAKIMVYQLAQAKDQGHIVKKVILIGGFGQSRRLKEYLRQKLALYDVEHNSKIVLVEPRSERSSSAVARGAVLRALRKEDGPARQLQCSFGFLRTERKGTFPEHAAQLGKLHKLHGVEFIENTVEWILQKGQHVATNHEKPLEVEYTFALKKETWICTVTLCVSDSVHESHYGFDHPKNSGAEVKGWIDFDVSGLKKQLTARLIDKGKIPCYVVNFTVVVIINGRNLRYEARRNGEVLAIGQSSLAAAFQPGTE